MFRLCQMPFALKNHLSFARNIHRNLSKSQKYLFNSSSVPKYTFSNESDLQEQEATKEQTDQLKNDEIQKILQSDSRNIFRNVAIIAHVDHGKTTLVDSLLRGSGCANEYQTMDSNQLEKEKGITILSKCTGVTFNGYKINIVDTPGHHDFGGEVERIMSMVDGVCLLVCATEGPMAQTKFVLQKALKQNLKPIVIINKVDRPSARPDEVMNEVFNLFCELDTPNELLDYPLFFSSGRDGWVRQSLNGPNEGMDRILQKIIDYIPPPKVMQLNKQKLAQIGEGSTFQMLVSQSESHPIFGKILIGKINQGEVKVNDRAIAIDLNGKMVESAKIFKILRRYGMMQINMGRAVAGDIVQIAGFSSAIVTNTLCEVGKQTVIQSVPIDPPMMQISIGINSSPISGKEGTKLTISQIKERLLKEAENDVALRVKIDEKAEGGYITILGRGDLHLAVLIERMRREGFELSITPPEIITKKCEKTGNTLEPIERVAIELDPQYANIIIEKIGTRKGIYEDCVNISKERQKLVFTIPTRGLVGLRSEVLNDTKGTGVMTQTFVGYQDYRGLLKKNLKGALLSMATGQCSAYALQDIQKFGQLFIGPGQKVYPGMVIGENRSSEGDLEVNPIREKKLTNVRSVMADDKIVVHPPRIFSLDDVIAYIRGNLYLVYKQSQDDELIEVTPKELRIRKKELDSTLRKKTRRDNKRL